MTDREVSYPATFIQDNDGCFTVIFRDVPEAITQGWRFPEAVEAAADALATGLEFYSERGEPFPPSTGPRHGEVLISVEAPGERGKT